MELELACEEEMGARRPEMSYHAGPSGSCLRVEKLGKQE